MAFKDVDEIDERSKNGDGKDGIEISEAGKKVDADDVVLCNKLEDLKSMVKHLLSCVEEVVKEYVS